MVIKEYSSDRAKEIADLFHRSVHHIDSSIYSEEQKEAWAPTPPDYDNWSARLKEKKPYLAIADNKVAGFIELEADGHIDCTYVLPGYQRLGVATALYKHVESIARVASLPGLYVEASVVAKPFFESLGFAVKHENVVERGGQELVNYTMEKSLDE